mmetsp:Transcript_8978/g.22223  ORF Transcript_8978/g.22223 Transcript_8978/m.22223 type:complete len:284 (-) Transcript_8978:821-1672(-)
MAKIMCNARSECLARCMCILCLPRFMEVCFQKKYETNGCSCPSSSSSSSSSLRTAAIGSELELSSLLFGFGFSCSISVVSSRSLSSSLASSTPSPGEECFSSGVKGDVMWFGSSSFPIPFDISKSEEGQDNCNDGIVGSLVGLISLSCSLLSSVVFPTSLGFVEEANQFQPDLIDRLLFTKDWSSLLFCFFGISGSRPVSSSLLFPFCLSFFGDRLSFENQDCLETFCDSSPSFSMAVSGECDSIPSFALRLSLSSLRSVNKSSLVMLNVWWFPIILLEISWH